MLRGDDDAIRRQRGDTLGVQVVIGDDVVRHADGGQELVDVVVGHPARRARSAFDRIHQRELPRSRVQHRTELRDQRHAGTVAVFIVAGQSELRVHVGRLAQRSPRGGALGDFGAAAGADEAAVDLVAERRHQQRNLRLRLPRPHDERDVVLACIVADMGGIEAARPIRRDAEADAFAPAERALIVVVEMDRAVLVGSGFPIVHRAGPVRSRHGACGQIDEAGMGCVRAGIGGGLGWDADGEIPRRQRGIRRRGATDGGAFQLAVVVEAGRCVALGWQRREENLRRASRRARLHSCGPRRHRRAVRAAFVSQ